MPTQKVKTQTTKNRKQINGKNELPLREIVNANILEAANEIKAAENSFKDFAEAITSDGSFDFYYGNLQSGIKKIQITLAPGLALSLFSDGTFYFTPSPL